MNFFGGHKLWEKQISCKTLLSQLNKLKHNSANIISISLHSQKKSFLGVRYIDAWGSVVGQFKEIVINIWSFIFYEDNAVRCFEMIGLWMMYFRGDDIFY